MATDENKELTKKVLNALDPKYISSQDQQDKLTSVFRKFRDHTKVLQTTAQKAAITGEQHLKKKGFFQKGKEIMGKMGTTIKNRFKRKQPGGTRKRTNTLANSMRK